VPPTTSRRSSAAIEHPVTLDYLIHARVPDVGGYDALYQRLIRRVRLADVSASFVMEEIKHTTAMPLTYA
jgi:DNA-binding Lrp family transcriptional regulator